MILEALAAFWAVFFADFVWARYIAAIAEARKLHASAWAVALMLLSGIATIAYVNNHWMLVPAAAGAFVGTYLSIRKARPQKIPDGIYLLTEGWKPGPMNGETKKKGP